jgi:hypothetical protein
VMAWTLRGSTVIPLWETIKPRRRPGGDAEHTLERVQANIILTTPLKDDS